MRKSVKVFRWILLGVASTLGSALHADLIVLKNGNEIRGKVLAKDEQSYLVEVPYGRMTIPARQVREVISETESEYLRRSGERLLGVRDHDHGLALLRKAARMNPGSIPCREVLVQGLISAAQGAIEDHSLTRAEQLLDECDGLDPENAGLARLRESVLALHSRRVELEDVADEAFVTQDVVRALETYRTLMKEFPEGKERWRERYSRSAALMGHVHLQENTFELARDCYHEALEQEPDLIDTLGAPLVYAEVRSVIPVMEEGRFAEASRRLEEARGLFPQQPAILYYLGLCREGEGKLSEAGRLYRELAGPEGKSIDGKAHLAELRGLAEQYLVDRTGSGAPGSDPRWKRSKGKPGVRATPSFAIHYDHEAQGHEVERHLEHHLRRLRSQWFKDNSFAGFKDRVAIYLHRDRETYLSKSGGPPWSNGVTRTQRRFGVIVGQEIHFNAASPQFLSSQLPHELVHVLVPYRLGTGISVPMWVEEGLATAEEPSYKQKYFDRVVKEAARHGTLFALQDLFTSKDYPTRDRVDVFYAQANSLVRYLRHRLGRRSTFALMRALSTSTVEEALETQRRFASVAEIERAWLKWAMKERG